MINYDNLNLDEELKNELKKLEIDYVFQPIFQNDGKTIFAHEALMRPKGRNVLDLIDEYTKMNKLHVLEVATLFGAVSSFFDRKYDGYIAINSFPSECFTQAEEDEFNRFFKDVYSDKAIIEILEYTILDLEKWEFKRETLRKKNLNIAIDDFGSGNNGIMAVDLFSPQIVKLDREIIANIHEDVDKQEKFFYYLDYMHNRGIKVLAEGVETEEEYNFLVEHKVDLLQGYYLARPK